MKVALIDLPQAGKRTLFCLLTGRTVPDSDGFPSKRRTGSSVTDFLFHPGEYHIEASSPIRSVTLAVRHSNLPFSDGMSTGFSGSSFYPLSRAIFSNVRSV